MAKWKLLISWKAAAASVIKKGIIEHIHSHQRGQGSAVPPSLLAAVRKASQSIDGDSNYAFKGKSEIEPRQRFETASLKYKSEFPFPKKVLRNVTFGRHSNKSDTKQTKSEIIPHKHEYSDYDYYEMMIMWVHFSLSWVYGRMVSPRVVVSHKLFNFMQKIIRKSENENYPNKKYYVNYEICIIYDLQILHETIYGSRVDIVHECSNVSDAKMMYFTLCGDASKARKQYLRWYVVSPSPHG